MKVALVHDYLKEFGGAEQVLLALGELFPHAPIYTSFTTPQFLDQHPEFKDKTIRPTFLQKVPLVKQFSKHYTFMYPFAFEQFDLREYDLVISDSACWAKGVITSPHQKHISYILTPPRFLYHYTGETDRRSLWLLKPLLTPLDTYLRIWDYQAAQRADCVVSISQTVAKRVRKFYQRDSAVIYPPVLVPTESPSSVRGDFYLVVSRLAKYKNIEVVIAAANRLRVPLKVVGIGREEKRLRELAGNTVEMLGFVSPAELANLYRSCKALIFPTLDEDFGIVPVEAMGHGAPVIAVKSGGVRETVVAGLSGEFYSPGTVAEMVNNLITVLEQFDGKKYPAQTVSQQANRYSRERFISEFNHLCTVVMKEVI